MYGPNGWTGTEQCAPTHAQYLSDKGRAGVIKLDSGGQGQGPRTLYLVPPSQQVRARGGAGV